MRITEGLAVFRGEHATSSIIYLTTNLMPFILAGIFFIASEYFTITETISRAVFLGLFVIWFLVLLGTIGMISQRIKTTAQGLNIMPVFNLKVIKYIFNGSRIFLLSIILSAPFIVFILGTISAAGFESIVSVPSFLQELDRFAIPAAILIIFCFLVVNYFVILFLIVEFIFVPRFPSLRFFMNAIQRLKIAIKEYVSAVIMTVIAHISLGSGIIITISMSRAIIIHEGDSLIIIILTVIVVLVLWLLLCLITLFLAPNWLGQYAYKAYHNMIERLIIHEYIDVLNDEERSMLNEGVVAVFSGTTLNQTPVVYQDKQYRLPAMENKTISTAVLQDLDANNVLIWVDENHRKNVLLINNSDKK